MAHPLLTKGVWTRHRWSGSGQAAPKVSSPKVWAAAVWGRHGADAERSGARSAERAGRDTGRVRSETVNFVAKLAPVINAVYEI